MKEVTVRNAGYINIVDSIPDGSGMRNSKKLLNELSKEFTIKSREFFDHTGDMPYIYREQQLHSVVVPILANIADVVLTELPTNRKIKNNIDETFGWVDYWVKLGSTIFLIELKHSYFGFKSSSLRKSSLKEWSTAIKQIKNIVDPCNFKINSSDKIVKIALNIITTFTSTIIESNSTDECQHIGNKILGSIPEDEKPNFMVGWTVHKDMLQKYEYSNGIEYYPYVHIIAKIENVEDKEC